ncbi:MAG: hypothetical protein E6H07_02495 [Bacteroidetes bacterium]|nr:MAG: hypothetical protein E6H07_02495 [Bacteroidota bacterium]
MDWLTEIIDWSEVWATLIPLIIFFIRRPNAPWIKSMVTYLCVLLAISLVVDITWKHKTLEIEDWTKKVFSFLFHGPNKDFNNAIFYNILSSARLILITWFFIVINKSYKKIQLAIAVLFLVFVVINFCFFENINEDFSSRLFSIEAGIILLYCLLFIYHVNLSDEIVSITSLSEFWAVTGFTLYAAINFFIFMFFQYLIKAAKEAFAIDIWNVHNISYIVLNLFIAFAIFKAEKTNNATSVN